MFDKKEAQSILKEVQENQRLLRSCRGHRFVVPGPYEPGMYIKNFACANCSGKMQYRDIKIYADGFIAAGGKTEDVILEVHFD